MSQRKKMVKEEGKSKEQSGWWWWWGLVAFFFAVAATVALHRCLPDDFDPVPVLEYSSGSVPVPERHERLLEATERIGEGMVSGPEDFAYDAQACALFTGCDDGWIKKISLCGEEPTVHNWTFTGGRPVGLAFGPTGQLFVTDAYKGLLKISGNGEIETLAKEAAGVKFGLPNGIDVSSNGMVYFSDTTYKYNLKNIHLDAMEGRPHGRLLRYDPSTKTTDVLLDGLYFANGVALSPQQNFVVVCESNIARCRKFHIEGEKKGSVENFIDNLPGTPDNIRYDGEGKFWIAFPVGVSTGWGAFMRYPSLRKAIVIYSRIKQFPFSKKNIGVLAVSADGNPLTLYSDHRLHRVTGGIKIGNFIYFGALREPYVLRLDLNKLVQHPA